MHRFNKSQQDAFLPHVESGLFTFIGATTENPSFEVNSALLSRAAVYVLQPLAEDDLQQIVAKAQAIDAVPAIEQAALRPPGGLCRRRCAAPAQHAGDAGGRRRQGEASSEITDAWLLKVLGERMRRYDKGGEQFYDTISALHKSVRGSDPDASLYWFVRMLDGGADPRYMARRLVRMAARTSAWPTRARCAWRWTPRRSTSGWARPRASWRWPSAWSTWPWRPSPTRSTRPSTKPRP